MKATVMGGLAELEGTAEEIVQALQLLNLPKQGTGPAEPTKAQKGPASVTIVGSIYVDVSFARAVLTRRELSKETKSVLHKIYEAFPGTVSATELASNIGYSTSQLSGLIGAFGRRVSHTPNYQPNTKFFTQSWDSAAKCYRYGLPETVRDAMRLEKLGQ